MRGSVIVAALRVSNGSVGAFPMRQMMQVFGPLAVDTANRNTALLMLGEFVLRLSLEPLLPEIKCIATKALLDAFPTDAATKAQLETLRVQCAYLMRLKSGRASGFSNVLRAVEKIDAHAVRLGAHETCVTPRRGQHGAEDRGCAGKPGSEVQPFPREQNGCDGEQ